MTGQQLLVEVNKHGGLTAVEVNRVTGGWANTLVCKDGWRYTPNLRLERDLILAMGVQEEA